VKKKNSDNFEQKYFRLLNTRLANFLSAVLHPLLMPTLLFVLLFFLAPAPLGAEALNVLFKLAIIGFVFIYTFALPAYIIYSLKRWGIISSLKLENLKDRRLPYLITAVIYTALGYFLYSKNSMLFPCGFVLWSISAVIFCVGIISLWWQISAHAAGIGGMIGALAGILVQFGETNLFYPFLLLIILAGYLIAARLALNAHTPTQVGAGFVLGFSLSLSAIFFFF
jgi:membrane-associated phospholipid phosphatase